MKAIKYLLLLFILGFGSINAQIVVIANKDVKESNLDLNKIKSIYKLEVTRWNSGESLTLFDYQTENKSKKEFYTKTGFEQVQLNKVWLRAKLSGEGKPPVLAASEEEMIKQISSTPGAVGYVSADKVNNDVKIISKLN